MTFAAPLLVGGLLEAIGVPGSIAVLATGVVAVKHLRDGLTIAAAVGLWLRFGAVLVLVGLVAVSGVVPGFRLVVDLGAIADAIAWLLESVDRGLEAARGVLPS
ncbi:hypothetical protein G9C85_00130 [Halorubellus sp. JP-L1]|uniref:hypothetical protein n=1 Tax=Halorubellus sp. JP-L1 TaxID=2715753 RepID=UPI0014087147|nr:hypothetical protein [Halorubellus sp. JP-L1]NHN40045.1 hypothetical protein [Halorubellus sp. JP-L1]